MLRLTVADIDRKRAALHIRNTKNGYDRIVPPPWASLDPEHHEVHRTSRRVSFPTPPLTNF